jgi:hypothetical protein
MNVQIIYPLLAIYPGGGGGMSFGDSDIGNLIGIVFGIIILIAAYIWWNRMMGKD